MNKRDIRRNTRWDIPPQKLEHFSDTANVTFSHDSLFIDKSVSSALFVFNSDAKVDQIDDGRSYSKAKRNDSLIIIMYQKPDSTWVQGARKQNPLAVISPGLALISNKAPVSVSMTDSTGAEMAVLLSME